MERKIQVLPNTQKVGRFNPSFPTFSPTPSLQPWGTVIDSDVGNFESYMALTRIIQNNPKDCETAKVQLS